jgi:hypothetical protein
MLLTWSFKLLKSMAVTCRCCDVAVLQVARGREGVGWQQLGATRLRCVGVVGEMTEDLLVAAVVVELCVDCK